MMMEKKGSCLNRRRPRHRTTATRSRSTAVAKILSPSSSHNYRMSSMISFVSNVVSIIVLMIFSSSSCVAHATTSTTLQLSSSSLSVAFVGPGCYRTRHGLLRQKQQTPSPNVPCTRIRKKHYQQYPNYNGESRSCQQRQQRTHVSMVSTTTTNTVINGISTATKESKTTTKKTTTKGSKVVVKGTKKNVTRKEPELKNEEDSSMKPKKTKNMKAAATSKHATTKQKKEKKKKKQRRKTTNKKKKDDNDTDDVDDANDDEDHYDKTYYWINDSDIFHHEFTHNDDEDNEGEAPRASTTTATTTTPSNGTRNRSKLTTSKLHFKIRGNPRPLRRHRTGRGFMYNPSAPAQESFKHCVKQLVFSGSNNNKDDDDLLPLPPLFTSDICLSVSIVFKLKRPLKDFINNKRVDGRLKESAPSSISSTIRQDVDNLAKFVLDSCNNLLYEDDKQIISLSTLKILDDENLCEGSTEIILRPVLLNSDDVHTIDRINGNIM